MNIVQARNITKQFKEGDDIVHALNGVSLSIDAGEIVAMEGPSGSGKTTLLSVLGCILAPSSGEIVIEGKTVDARRTDDLPEIRRRSIGFIFQHFNLFPPLTAVENVEYALNIKGYRGPECREKAEELLESVGLADRKKFLPRDLSGGQKQRVAIARALAGEPKILLADEPTANLDSHLGMQILELFRTIVKGQNRALFVVTHDTKVRKVADRVLTIADGHLVS